MDKIQKQRSSIVLYREKGNGEHYIRIKYANNPAIALLLSQESGIQMADNASAYITVTAFKLPDFSDRSSPYAYIDYSRTYVQHPNSQQTYMLPEDYLKLLNLTSQGVVSERIQVRIMGKICWDTTILKMTNIYLHVTNALKSSIPNSLDTLDDL